MLWLPSLNRNKINLLNPASVNPMRDFWVIGITCKVALSLPQSKLAVLPAPSRDRSPHKAFPLRGRWQPKVDGRGGNKQTPSADGYTSSVSLSLNSFPSRGSLFINCPLMRKSRLQLFFHSVKLSAALPDNKENRWCCKPT